MSLVVCKQEQGRRHERRVQITCEMHRGACEKAFEIGFRVGINHHYDKKAAQGTERIPIHVAFPRSGGIGGWGTIQDVLCCGAMSFMT
jgi:hypothetical protein